MSIFDEGYKCARKEIRTLDIILKLVEKGNYDALPQFEGFYSGAVKGTDQAIEELFSKYNIKTLRREIKKFFDEKQSESTEVFLFAGLLDSALNSKMSKSIAIEEKESFRQEYLRIVYAVYRDYMNSHDVDEQVKKALHHYMKIKLSESQFIRNYFSGKFRESFIASTPDNKYDREKVNELAEKEYYAKLNDLINSTNCDEMFEGLIRSDLLEAKKIKAQIEFAAIGFLMDERGIKYPVTEVPISDYTEDIIRKASDLLNEIKKERQEEEKQKPMRIILIRF